MSCNQQEQGGSAPAAGVVAVCPQRLPLQLPRQQRPQHGAIHHVPVPQAARQRGRQAWAAVSGLLMLAACGPITALAPATDSSQPALRPRARLRKYWRSPSTSTGSSGSARAVRCAASVSTASGGTSACSGTSLSWQTGWADGDSAM